MTVGRPPPPVALEPACGARRYVAGVEQRISLVTLGVAGTPNVPNPFYGSGFIFQYPSAFRLGAKFSF